MLQEGEADDIVNKEGREPGLTNFLISLACTSHAGTAKEKVITLV